MDPVLGVMITIALAVVVGYAVLVVVTARMVDRAVCPKCGSANIERDLFWTPGCYDCGYGPDGEGA